MKLQWNKQYSDAVLIALAVIFPIILIGEPFADDYFRMTGVRDFTFDGRYMVTYLFRILSQNNFLFNLFPIPQISGIVIYSLTLIFIIRKVGIFSRIQSGLLLLVALTTPYMLAVYPYNYDTLSILIALSIFSLSPFIFNPNQLKYNNREVYIKSFYKSVIIIFGFLFYQPVLPTFIIFSLFLFSLTKNNYKVHILFYNAITFIFSYLIYTKIILNIGGNATWYKAQSKIDIALIPANIIDGMKDVTLLAVDYYKGFNAIPILIGILFALFISWQSSKHKPSIEKFIYIILIPMMLFITLILICVTNITSENLHLRLMISISSALFCIFLMIFINIKHVKLYNILIISIIVPSVTTLCMFAYAYKLQKQYERMLISSLYNGFNYIHNHVPDETTIYFVCQNDCLMPYSQKLVEKKPFMADLLYNKTWFHFFSGMNVYFKSYNIKDTVWKLDFNETSDNFWAEDKKVFSHYLYDIYLYKSSKQIFILVK